MSNHSSSADSSRHSSASSSRSPTPVRLSPSPSPKITENPNSYLSDPKKYIFQIIYALVFLYYIYIIVVSSFFSGFCESDQNCWKFCVDCPQGAICTKKDFACKDEQSQKFFRICHAPGNMVKSEDLKILHEYQTKIYKFAKGKTVTVSDVVEHFRNNTDDSYDFDENDVEIIWTYDRHYYINDQGVLSYHLPQWFIFIVLNLLVYFSLKLLDHYFTCKYFTIFVPLLILAIHKVAIYEMNHSIFT
ncbi:hypothetical protein TRFO_24970 [Tritrichomonas foetus]|uniref:Uncharacterized protein n=1 Tax=Tritrichomonas foetus TaxID=1144522 RepID=A0A1J4K7E3_9EUKA|nr:hypothetical protein TRFO_24970 [Tritrichomonas foetus]|eukprot:OHT06922.1 hypothetical protein TRFO_24970 [Tritrichomonas foetus]